MSKEQTTDLIKFLKPFNDDIKEIARLEAGSRKTHWLFFQLPASNFFPKNATIYPVLSIQ